MQTSTALKGRSWIERVLGKRMLQKIYGQELELLARLAENPDAAQSIQHQARK